MGCHPDDGLLERARGGRRLIARGALDAGLATCRLSERQRYRPASGQAGGPLILAFTNGFSANGTYTYALDRALVAECHRRRYRQPLRAASPPARRFRTTTATRQVAMPATSIRTSTQLSLLVGYSSYFSGSTDSNAITTTIGVVHQFAPSSPYPAPLAASGATLATQPTALAPGTRFHDSGALYGGNVIYSFSERSQLTVNVNEYLAPSSFGSLTKTPRRNGLVDASVLGPA